MPHLLLTTLTATVPSAAMPGSAEMALEMGVLLCGFSDECNSCEAPAGKVWASISETQDGSEVNYYVCEKCLPKKYAEHMAELRFWAEFAEAFSEKQIEQWIPQSEKLTGRTGSAIPQRPDHYE